MEALWPDEDSARLSNRLSVALSTVRTVLDPERRYASDRFVPADKHIVGLADVPVDVEEFLTVAAAGLDRSPPRAGRGAVVAGFGETAYTGDFLEDDLYDDWAVSLREEARVVYLAVARTLGAVGRRGGRARSGRPLPPQGAGARRLRRGGPPLVATLAAAGRHGEARRRYRIYGEKMDERGVEQRYFVPRGAQRLRWTATLSRGP